MENCLVIGANVYESGYTYGQTGGIVGYVTNNNKGIIKGCSLKNSVVIGGARAAGIVESSNDNLTIDSGAVTNCLILSIDPSKSGGAGGVVERSYTNTCIKNLTVKNTTVGAFGSSSGVMQNDQGKDKPKLEDVKVTNVAVTATSAASCVGSWEPADPTELTFSGTYLYGDNYRQDDVSGVTAGKEIVFYDSAENKIGTYKNLPDVETTLKISKCMVDGNVITNVGTYGEDYGYKHSQEQKYTITVNHGSHGTVTPSATSAEAVAIVFLVIQPDDGYQLSSITSPEVSLEGTGNIRVFTMPEHSVTVSAEFEKAVLHTITLNPCTGISGFRYTVGGGNETAYTAPFTVENGTMVILEAVLEEGYEFTQWAEGKTENPLIIESVTGDITYTPVTSLKKSRNSSSSVTSFSATKNGNDFTFRNAVVVTEATLPRASNARITNTSGSGWYNFDMTAEGFTGNGVMYFQVPLDVLEVKGFTTGDVGLYHQENGRWVLKPTTFLKKDNQYAYYSAEFDSCSPFMIDFENGVTTTATVQETPVTVTDTQGYLKVLSTPAGATIQIEGVDYYGITPQEKISLVPGAYQVILSLDGYEDTVATAIVKSGETSTVTLNMKKTETATQTAAKSPIPVLGILTGLGAAGFLAVRRK